jgi:hypothetical protein
LEAIIVNNMLQSVWVGTRGECARRDTRGSCHWESGKQEQLSIGISSGFRPYCSIQTERLPSSRTSWSGESPGFLPQTGRMNWWVSSKAFQRRPQASGENIMWHWLSLQDRRKIILKGWEIRA